MEREPTGRKQNWASGMELFPAHPRSPYPPSPASQLGESVCANEANKSVVAASASEPKPTRNEVVPAVGRKPKSVFYFTMDVAGSLVSTLISYMHECYAA
jgi:hypothetical protein